MTTVFNALPRTTARTGAMMALLLTLWLSPAFAGDTTTVQDDTVAPVIMMDSEGNAVSATGGDLIIMPSEETVVTDIEEMATEGHAAESKGGFPQLDVTTYSSQVFWLAVSFALLYLLMSRIALPRVTEVLDMRQTQINTNLDRAAQLNDEAEKAKQAFESILSDAQDNAREAVNTAEQKVAERASADNSRFAEHARERVTTAESNIAKAKAEALNSLADIAAEVAADMANKVAKTHLTKADALPAVKAQMDKAA